MIVLGNQKERHIFLIRLNLSRVYQEAVGRRRKIRNGNKGKYIRTRGYEWGRPLLTRGKGKSKKANIIICPHRCLAYTMTQAQSYKHCRPDTGSDKTPVGTLRREAEGRTESADTIIGN